MFAPWSRLASTVWELINMSLLYKCKIQATWTWRIYFSFYVRLKSARWLRYLAIEKRKWTVETLEQTQEKFQWVQSVGFQRGKKTRYAPRKRGRGRGVQEKAVSIVPFVLKGRHAVQKQHSLGASTTQQTVQVIPASPTQTLLLVGGMEGRGGGTDGPSAPSLKPNWSAVTFTLCCLCSQKLKGSSMVWNVVVVL